MDNDLESLGFKRVDHENVLAPDETWRGFVGYGSPDDYSVWHEEVSAYRLRASVPKEIRAMVEVAKATMLYAWYFYPFLAVANSQLDRALEAAVRLKCASLEIKITNASYFDLIHALREQGVLPGATASRWDLARKLRNHSSHPNFQTIITPNMALNALMHADELIEDLFTPISPTAIELS
jgi:hypothetical protein